MIGMSTTLICRLFGHKIVRAFHSAGYTDHCRRCKQAETVRNYS